MEIIVEKKAPNHGFIKVTLKKADYQAQVNQKLKEYSKKANLKGFRPGKVPIGYIHKIYGTEIIAQTVFEVLQERLTQYIKEESLKLVGEMIPVETGEESIDWKNQEEFEFSYEIGLVPEFQYDLQALILDKYEVTIGETEIKKAIDNLKETFSEEVTPEMIEEADFESLQAMLTFYPASLSEQPEEATDEMPFPKRYLLFFDAESFAKPETLQQFIGKKIEEEVTLNVLEAFNHSEQASLEQKLMLSEAMLATWGNEYVFKIVNIRKLTPAQMNEDFFNQVFPHEPQPIQDEETFKGRISEEIAKQYQQEIKAIFETQAREHILKEIPVDISDEFLSHWFETLDNKVKPNEFEIQKEFIVWSLLVNRLVTDFELQFTNEEVEERAIDELSAMMQGINLRDPQFANFLPNFVKEHLSQNDGQNYTITAQKVLEDKIFRLLEEKATLQIVKVDTEKFQTIAQEFSQQQQAKYAQFASPSEEEYTEVEAETSAEENS